MMVTVGPATDVIKTAPPPKQGTFVSRLVAHAWISRRKVSRDGCHKVYEYDQNGDGQTEAYAVVNFVKESLWGEYLIYVGNDLRLERRYLRHTNGDASRIETSMTEMVTSRR